MGSEYQRALEYAMTGEITETGKEDEEDALSVEALQKAMPPGRKGIVSQALVDKVNGLLADEDRRHSFRQNLIGFTRVLGNGKWRVTDYVNAVLYVTHKVAGDSNIVAYTKVFPERFRKMVDKGYDVETIHNSVKAFNSNALVAKVMEQTLVPAWVLNQDMYQRALNTQAELMMYAKSEKVRSDAANSLLTHLKMPETAKVELDVNVKEDDSINELRRVTLDLVAQQRKMLEAGAMTARDVAEQRIVGEVVSEQ